MIQPNPENNVLENYLKACGFGLSSPDRAVRSPIKLTGDLVRDYIAIAGFGYLETEKPSSTKFDS